MKYAIIDFRTTMEEKYSLKNLGLEVLVCPPSPLLYKAVCGHPDMLLHIIDSKTIMVHKDMDKNFVEILKTLDFDVVFSSNSLKENYPENIILNSISLPKLFIHNLKHTDNNLLSYMRNKISINVKQGYTKCSTAIVSKNSVMTSDKTIAKALIKEDMDVLLLPPGDILLPGLNYGFIGGCCGLIDENSMAFYGDLNYYAFGKEVLNFLKKYDVEPIFLKKGKLIDRGSLFIVNN
ncbi:DUF6873 family GME fold protein [Clostridium magnum]|uniref:DUF6873 domain-containing protein n=1 Tax=Clostridium magnum DSM 2767 TaxID=1121326 RepID=A0A162U924_9CLOT|nr:hypothetical protein [Clostridium magnum]KZL93655.1 hypothetical protein CLMAG_07060 [Clostridium magnum DSM 2767]SHI93633.1 hypothetical protein SAMN02745944_05092 [Clostridium magnum DSM 2767]